MICLWSGPPRFNCWTSVAPAFQTWFAVEYSSCFISVMNIFFLLSVYYRYIYITYMLQIKNMKLLRVGAPSIHTSLKLILADKKNNNRKTTKKKKKQTKKKTTNNKDYLISYTVISASKYVPPDPKSYTLPQSVVSRPRSHAQ